MCGRRSERLERELHHWPIPGGDGVGVGAAREAVGDVHGGEGEDGERDGEGHAGDGVDPEDDVEEAVLPEHEGLEERVEQHLGVAPLRYLGG